jgi:hypothetical protein
MKDFDDTKTGEMVEALDEIGDSLKSIASSLDNLKWLVIGYFVGMTVFKFFF